MYALVFIARAFGLIGCCFSKPCRARTLEHLKKTTQTQVVIEVGTGILGLVVIGAIIAVIIVSSQK
jgi:hypothetical protein